MIADPSKPLLDGGLGPGRPWYMQQQLQELARKARINLKKPYEELPAKARTVLLEGANGLPGILEILQQSFESSTEGYREWLTEYMSPVECPSCHGKRLKASSLAVRVKSFSIAEFAALPVARALMTARNWEFGERETQIAGRVVEEIRRRLEFLSAVGLDYLSLERSAAASRAGSRSGSAGHADRLEAARRSVRARRPSMGCIRAITGGCWRR